MMRARRCPGHPNGVAGGDAGFTLVETLAALSILVVLTSVVAMTVQSINLMFARGDQKNELVQATRMAIETLKAPLRDDTLPTGCTSGSGSFQVDADYFASYSCTSDVLNLPRLVRIDLQLREGGASGAVAYDVAFYATEGGY